MVSTASHGTGPGGRFGSPALRYAVVAVVAGLALLLGAVPALGAGHGAYQQQAVQSAYPLIIDVEGGGAICSGLAPCAWTCTTLLPLRQSRRCSGGSASAAARSRPGW
jgi:hypothetical protein